MEIPFLAASVQWGNHRPIG